MRWTLVYFLPIYSLIAYFFFGLFVPYTDLLCILPSTWFASYTPLTTWYFTPGKSFTLHPLIITTLCSCNLCFSPGIYAITSCPFDNLTFAIFLCAELGFFGVWIVTLIHTPLLNGLGISIFLLFFIVLTPYWSAGAFDFLTLGFLLFFKSWLYVGILAKYE